MSKSAYKAVAVLVLLSACTTDIGIVTATDPDSFSAPAYVTYYNTDTASVRDIDILLRTDRRFDGRPLELSVKTIAPDTSVFEEPFSITADGGDRNDSYTETKATYRHNAVLQQRGRYVFKFTPTAESNGVKGVTGIGIKIENGKE